MRRWLCGIGFVCLAAVMGCSSDPGSRPEPVDVTGTVVDASGKPVKDVQLNILATESDQLPGNAQLKANGKFAMKLVPGKYTYYFAGRSLKQVPAKYHSPNADIVVEVPDAGGAIDIKLAE